MNQQYPVYTEDTECQDCYKCLRHCPTKAIKVVNGKATVMPERCIACGICVGVCPNKAKHIRDDLRRAGSLFTDGVKVIAALAPSWTSEFSKCSNGQMIKALKCLGFQMVSETALGAQMISQRLAQELKNSDKKLVLSSACPAADAFVSKYLPEFTNCITDVISPVLAHCELLKSFYGNDIKVVFFSPCIAKKNEADARNDLLSCSLTFKDLHEWFDKKNIVPEKITPDGDEVFSPEKAEDGVLYPVEGGMLRTIKLRGGADIQYVTISGIADIEQALSGLDVKDLQKPVFLELLACKGGCINGPCMSENRPGLLNIVANLNKAEIPEYLSTTGAELAVGGAYLNDHIDKAGCTDEELRLALLRVGKSSDEDELNCGGCGYDTCREFAKALLDGRAEPVMCLSYLRNMAQKKANAMIRCMPSSVVIVNNDMKIVESNKHFAMLVGSDAMDIWNASEGMEGASLEKLVPFAHLFKENLENGDDIHKSSLKAWDKILDVSIFSIETGHIAGAVISDVTNPGMRREQIAKRARMVIKKNLETVQSIAANLGENMAETEILLRSLAKDYAGEADSDIIEEAESE